MAAGAGLAGAAVRGRRRTTAIVAGWWSIEALHGEVSAFRWQEQHDSALIEAALTNGVRDGAWHADRWGVVFEVLFDTQGQWEAFRGLPAVRAALDASRIRSMACSSTAAAAAGLVPGSRAGRSPRRTRGPFRCPGPQTNRIWIWRLPPHRPRRTSGQLRQGRDSGRRVHAGRPGRDDADTAPVLRPSVSGTEELAATGRSITGRECLKRSQAPEPPFCAGVGFIPITTLAVQTRPFCARASRRRRRGVTAPRG